MSDPATCCEASVKAYLQDLTMKCMSALNNRNFDPDAPPWRNHLADHFEATANGTTVVRTKLQALENFACIARQFPEYMNEVERINVVIQRHLAWSRSTKTRSAKVFVNAHTEGRPNARKYVNVYEFRFIDGIWVAVKENLIAGIGGAETLVGM
ncbi:hypothetical protein CLAFUW4_12976 [Fulvia fulva]|uniref:Uncharacterized protein n=1 Tax=Passalora fulva TaxID=5499 RepID=A0A9Q8PIQ8_PASFU|nr:uncharacterized protein CLAFUR5_12838 [Fulvia fulva]KAK4611573.1 hypothetical protein CLAFUR4_12980 [Fulvia fulva]KAK4613043.1 hypothetical protein CLAFUR0_12985 [Fulvia fulva]UJO23301.1 hypothetical protein CLAFUR5_12838 [Fulvia fulva]WPV21135.1 hypothetical protein CLAFUW4_12976 [Fulvia fulva]WPV35911.1 hypothetical protein CLAFUW7_12983 [Fulvia fulva]